MVRCLLRLKRNLKLLTSKKQKLFNKGHFTLKNRQVQILRCTASWCQQDGSGGVRPDCNAHAVTYDEAVQLCESNGYRLCTIKELLYDEITNGQGCSYDNAYNWASDECTEDILWLLPDRLIQLGRAGSTVFSYSDTSSDRSSDAVHVVVLKYAWMWSTLSKSIRI